MSGQLATLNYHKLLSDISEIYERAMQQSIIAVNKITVSAYWEIGRRIVQEEQKGNLRAEYGERVLERLSGDLTQKFDRGFSVSNLQYMRQLYICYRIHQAPGELSWTHLQLLSVIKDGEKRRFFEEQAVKQQWSSRELLRQIRKNKVELLKLSLERRLKRKQITTAPKLSLTRGRLFTYKLIKQTQEDTLFVDCGFNFKHKESLNGLSNPEDGQIVTSTKNNSGYRFEPSDASTKQLYTYQAVVEEVTDADTILAEIDLGFDNWLSHKLRFRGIDCPEASTKKGQKAKEFVKAALSKVNFIIIKFHGFEKYGRCLSDIFYLEGESDPQKVLEQGIFLNQQLLDLGLAKLAE